MAGCFIVFEGPDGGGTTTHAALLAERMRREGREVVLTAEPTAGVHGQRVRDALRGKETLDPEELQRLFSLDRADHVATVIAPALALGKVVISDRFTPSTLIYGEAAGVPRALLEEWNAGFPKPDCLLLTLPPLDTSLERLSRRATRDRFEQEAFQRRVYQGYVRYSAEHREARVIDTSGAKEQVAEEVWGYVRHALTF